MSVRHGVHIESGQENRSNTHSVHIEKCTLSARENAPPAGRKKRRKSLIIKDFLGFGGLYWTRTSDPIDVNDVLYQLSQQTIPFLTRDILT